MSRYAPSVIASLAWLRVLFAGPPIGAELVAAAPNHLGWLEQDRREISRGGPKSQRAVSADRHGRTVFAAAMRLGVTAIRGITENGRNPTDASETPKHPDQSQALAFPPEIAESQAMDGTAPPKGDAKSSESECEPPPHRHRASIE